VRFDIDVITKGAETVMAEGTEVITDVEEMVDIIEEKNWCFFFIS
jgi:hypothetical protein